MEFIFEGLPHGVTEMPKKTPEIGGGGLLLCLPLCIFPEDSSSHWTHSKVGYVGEYVGACLTEHWGPAIRCRQVYGWETVTSPEITQINNGEMFADFSTDISRSPAGASRRGAFPVGAFPVGLRRAEYALRVFHQTQIPPLRSGVGNYGR